MDEDYLDYNYEDELEAMQDVNEEYEALSKSRKSLDFSTPSSVRKSKCVNLDNSFATPLNESSQEDKFSPTSNGVLEQPCFTAEDEFSSNNRRHSKKRSADDVFDSLSAEETARLVRISPCKSPESKRQKTCEEDNSKARKEHIKGIIDEIDKLKTKSNSMRNFDVDADVPTNIDDRVLTRIPRGDYMSATRSQDGNRVYLRLKDEAGTRREMMSLNTGKRALHLLGLPYSVLKAQIEEDKAAKRQEDIEEEANLLDRTIDKSGDNLISSTSKKAPNSQSTSTNKNHALWVEKYAPSKYTDLLSDESTNRLLLKWLKLWDHVVYGKEVQTQPKTAIDKKKKENVKDKPVFKGALPELETELDKHNRPTQRVALLHGPPGLGKTTLAHVIARHSGYNVVEINASDDRSQDLFKKKIEAATQMKSVIGADARPNCLIIDEIDGAPQPAINMLLKMIKGPENAPSKKKNKTPLLMRPIICICNDLYVPSLRQLRSMALVVNFRETQTSKLATRLLEVTKYERIKADMTTMMALCDKADNDIRSCLNTLQFIKSRGKSEISLRNVHSMSLGQKDAHKNLFTVWNQIFQMPRPKRKQYVNPYDRGTTSNHAEMLANNINQNNMSHAYRFKHIFDLILASGDQDKVIQGLYESYLKMKIKDPNFDAVLLANDWICFVDGVKQQVAHSQNWTLYRYTPYLPVLFHLLFASTAPEKVTYPRVEMEVRTKTTKHCNILETMLSDVAPSIRKSLNTSVIVMEILPPLMEVIQPTLRPVNTQLYSAREKEGLSQLIKIMIAYNMTYSQERSMDGQYVYTLEPALDEVSRFPDIKQQKPLTYAAKQLIAREIELEKMRRSEAPRGSDLGSNVNKATLKGPEVSSAKTENKSSSLSKNNDENLPTHKRQKLQPKPIKEVEFEVVYDFFGRKVEKKTVEEKKVKEDLKKEIIASDVWFRFKEGYSNAVRKIVRVQDFL